MITYEIDIGTAAKMKIDDYSAVSSHQIWWSIRPLVPLGPGQYIRWRYTMNGSLVPPISSSPRSHLLQAGSTNWEAIGVIYVGTSNQPFTIHLEDTGNPILGGPVDLTIPLLEVAWPPNRVKIKDGVTYKTALPFVKVAGVWKPANAYVNQNDIWKPTT